jgi:hypothetical protein
LHHFRRWEEPNIERIAPVGVVLLRFSQIQTPPMAFFYDDNTGTRRGPVSREELQTLANQGKINPQTRLETEDGRRGLAGQVSGLTFPTKPEEYFNYYDSKTAERKGPYNRQKLKSLAGNGTIKKDTIIETPDGKTTEAGKVTWIWEDIIPIPPISPKRNDDDTSSITSQSDFSPIPPKRDDDDTDPTPARVGGFLDITFTRFITNIWLPIIWCIFLVSAVGASLLIPILLAGIAYAVSSDISTSIVVEFIASFVLIPMLLLGLLSVRMALEATMVFFRMEKHLRKMSGGN